MSLITVNTGNYNDLFADLDAALAGSWVLFVTISADEKIYTVSQTPGGYSPVATPSFIRIFRDNTAFSVRLTIYDFWTPAGGPGTNPIPAIDGTTKNVLDFSSAIITAAWRIYGDAAEGYIAILHDGAGGLVATTGFWIGVLQGRATPAAHPNPNAIFYKTTIGADVACDFLDQNLAAQNETAASFFNFNLWSNSTEQHTGLSPLVSAFAFFSQTGVSSIAGIAKHLFQCSGGLAFADTVTIAAAVHRVMRGGSYAILE